MMFKHSLTEKSVASLVALSVTSALLALIDVGTTAEQPLMRLERVLIIGQSSEPTQLLMQRVERMPRVLVLGQRADGGDQRLAQLSCAPEAMC
ncbi:hypothetical protein PEC18_06795 [Paucibacter sp. O1-1]|nr:hypothetical protein [Paucibacter sp. O1-1]MDA3825579.1 hypothetical protein [Paucibacter sp. O1-1]